MDRKPLVLLVCARSLLAILLPARNVGTLPSRLGDVVAERPRRFGIDRRLIDAELAAMVPVHVAKTADRGVVGILVDFALATPHHLPVGGWDETTLLFIEAALAETPCYSSRPFAQTVFPNKATPELLQSRWGAG